jgi:hypothetical protein
MVRNRGTEDRFVMKLSLPPSGSPSVSRLGSCGVCGACELVQLKRLAIPPRPGRWEMEGRLDRNCLKDGGVGCVDVGCCCGWLEYCI